MVIYDIFFAYLEDAYEAFEAKDWDYYKEAVRHAQRALTELMEVLDFSHRKMAANLYSIYAFCRDTLAKALYKRDLEEVKTAERLMKKLYQSFSEIARQDTSKPLMANTEQVYAGYTYGRSDVTEVSLNMQKNRGFLV